MRSVEAMPSAGTNEHMRHYEHVEADQFGGSRAQKLAEARARVEAMTARWVARERAEKARAESPLVRGARIAVLAARFDVLVAAAA